MSGAQCRCHRSCDACGRERIDRAIPTNAAMCGIDGPAGLYALVIHLIEKKENTKGPPRRLLIYLRVASHMLTACDTFSS
eukprot:COSAG01_NODE_7797_length_3052_cov_5.665764_6_plen_80_part_00